jgi:hypothetical protein
MPAKMGTRWTDTVTTGWTEASLHHLVMKKGNISTAKTKDLYGHFRTKTQMGGILGPYWTKNPVEETELEIRRLNTTTLEVVERLKQLCKGVPFISYYTSGTFGHYLQQDYWGCRSDPS